MRARVVHLCVLVAVLTTAAACARRAPYAVGGPAASPSSWVTVSVDVTGVTAGPGAAAVTIHVSEPAGRGDCARDPRVTDQEEQNNVIYANVVLDSAADTVIGACLTLSPGEVVLRSTQPIGNRSLSINQKAWALVDGHYMACDQYLGCHPPKDRCSSPWVESAVRGLDVSNHSQGTVESCDGSWLIMTVPDDPAQCGAEPRPGCEVNTGIRRYFFQNQPAGWKLLVASTAGGCSAVVKVAPTFPERLCTGLPPTGRYIRSAAPVPSGGPRGG